MTREEQITFKAGSIADGCIAHGAPWEDYYQGFIEGAKWADANPSKPSLPSNLDEAAETYSKEVSNGHSYRDLICGFKAGAEWQKSQMVPNEDVFKIWGTTEKEYLAKSMDKVHLEMEISTYLKDWEDDEEIGLHLSTDNGCIPIELEDVRDLARHFYELGFNARKA